MRTVSVVTQFVPQYRTTFWEGLRSVLETERVRLRLLHGRPHRAFAHRRDSVRLDWFEPVPMREVRIAGRDLVYLSVGGIMRASDLVITNQEVRLLHNFRLLLDQLRDRGRLALMGHGRDGLKRGRTSVSELTKIWMSRRVHWWFAYNELSARQVKAFGYPPERITTFMNSTDTRELVEARCRATQAELDALRASLELGPGPCAIYVGAIDPIKHIGYLLAGARQIRARLPSFELLLVGAGPERARHEADTREERWIHWVAPQFGRDKARHMLLADVCLLPAGVGLGIVDTFALGVPLVTTDRFPHGVEIDYLEHGRNGWICRGAPDAAAFGDAVADLLCRPEELRALRAGSLQSGARFSIESMIDRFAGGVLAALDAPPYR